MIKRNYEHVKPCKYYHIFSLCSHEHRKGKSSQVLLEKYFQSQPSHKLLFWTSVWVYDLMGLWYVVLYRWVKVCRDLLLNREMGGKLAKPILICLHTYMCNIYLKHTSTIFIYNIRVQYLFTIYVCNIYLQHTCTIFMDNMHVQYLFTIYMYNIYLQYTRTIFICNIHVQYLFKIYEYNIYLPYTCAIYMYNIHVQYLFTLHT